MSSTEHEKLTEEISAMREFLAELEADSEYSAEQVGIKSRIARLEMRLRELPRSQVENVRSEPVRAEPVHSESVLAKPVRRSIRFPVTLAAACGAIVSMGLSYAAFWFSSPRIGAEILASVSATKVQSPERGTTQAGIRSVATKDGGLLIVEAGSTFNQESKTLVEGSFLASTHDRIRIGTALASTAVGTWYHVRKGKEETPRESYVTVEVWSGTVSITGDFCDPIEELVIKEGEKKQIITDCAELKKYRDSKIEEDGAIDFSIDSVPVKIEDLMNTATDLRRATQYDRAVSKCREALQELKTLDYSSTPELKILLEDSILTQWSKALEDKALSLSGSERKQAYAEIISLWAERQRRPPVFRRAEKELAQPGL